MLAQTGVESLLASPVVEVMGKILDDRPTGTLCRSPRALPLVPT
jgi:hypothetical protein